MPATRTRLKMFRLEMYLRISERLAPLKTRYMKTRDISIPAVCRIFFLYINYPMKSDTLIKV